MAVYLDYNASAPIDESVLNKMIEVYRSTIGNPDSRTHSFGDNARNIVEEARKQVASLLSVEPTEVFFTSGATESNNIAIQGLREYAKKTGKNHIITTAIEHKAVLETVKHLGEQGFDITIVSPDLSGRVDSKQVLNAVRQDTLLVSVMHVNNETGIIQPVEEIGKGLQDTDVLFHVDATQSCGKLVKELRELNYNMISFSAHKLGGPQGVGVLVLKKKNAKRLPIKAITYGGQQEGGIRPGTVPVALVAGCGEACAVAAKTYMQNSEHNKAIKSIIIDELNNSGLDYQIIGDQSFCVDSTINVALIGVVSEALMIATKQFCGVSNGSACTSKSYSPSYVLKAMGIPDGTIANSIRVSWGHQSNYDEVKASFNMLLKTAYSMVN